MIIQYLACEVRQLRVQLHVKLGNLFCKHLLSSDEECNHYTEILSKCYIYKYNSGHIHIF